MEYVAHLIKARLAQVGITQSMKCPGKVTDKAFIEALFNSMKSEVHHGLRYHRNQDMRAVLKR